MAAFAVHPSDYPMGINAPLLPTDPRAGVMPLSGDPALDEFFKGLSTGILLLDAVLCITIPLVLQVIVSALFRSSGGALTKLRKWLGLSKNLENIVLRTIEITQRFNDYGNKIWDYEQKNHLLQKAISLYLTKTLNLTDKDGKYDLFEKPLKRAGKSLNGHEDGDDATDTSELSCTDDGSESDYDYDCSVSVDKLSVKAMPQHNTWIEVEKGVEFMHEVQENDGEKKGPRESKVIFNFRSTLPDASDRIDAIIDRAFIEYREMERQKHITDKTRYFYIQSGTKSGSGDENASRIVAYKRYALGEEKTFDNLFFQDKRQVLQLLDSFTSKSGKFAIKGFPYKLGLLLHGPPGTGKTSLIKAIAQHTKRHIVTISLGKIKTNQELLDALFDMKFAVHGHDTPFELMFEDVVFVMEDIDCASSIVNARDDQESSKSTSRADKMVGSQKKAKKVDTTDDSDGLPDLMGPLLKPKTTDKLNLSGLLNVLDGVIDCPGRILIMTTNHPEKLDPALIRPGRVNKKLFLSHIQAPQAREMIEHYCAAPMSEEQVAVLDETFADMELRTTPAELEELCAEFDDAAAILEQLAKKNVDV